MKSEIPKPAPQLQSFPACGPASPPPVDAAHADARMVEVIAQIDAWLETERARGRSDTAIAELCVSAARSSPAPYARELCRAALDVVPAHAGALAMFEQLVDETWRDELCARYLAFLEDASFHAVPPRQRAEVLGKLIRAEEDARANVASCSAHDGERHRE